MNKNLFLLSIIFISVLATAQEAEPLVRRVVYDFTYVYDTAQRDQPLKEQHQLLIGQRNSHYTKGNNIPQTQAALLQAMPSGPVRTVAAVPLATVTDPAIPVMNLFQYTATQKLLVSERVGIKQFIIETKLPAINWQVGTATRQIAGYNCQEATGVYGGRTYTVWFTPDIPLQNGPWKLSGLPGLILEAKDAKNEVSFVATSITNGEEGQLTDYEHTKYITTTATALDRAKKAYEESPVATMQAQLSPGSQAPRLRFIDITGKSYSGADAEEMIEKRTNDMKKGRYNPMELKK